MHRTKTIVYLFAVFLALSLSVPGALAQEKQEKNEAKSKSVTLTGCLQKGDEADEFSLAGDNGKSYELVSKKVALKDHIGHKVTVTGRAKVEESEADEKKEEGEGWSGQIRVTSLKMVSTSCK